ncbi:MAG: hypothetical protein RLZZ196_419 [Bacteroidota bacterium]|jgi:hypothetical protein
MKNPSILFIPLVIGSYQLITNAPVIYHPAGSSAVYKKDQLLFRGENAEICIFNNNSSPSCSLDLSEMTEVVKKKVIKKKRARKIKKISKKKEQPKIIPIQNEELLIYFSDDRNKILLSGVGDLRLNYLITDNRGKRVAHGPLQTNVLDLSNLSPNNYEISIYDKNIKIWSNNYQK